MSRVSIPLAAVVLGCAPHPPPDRADMTLVKPDWRPVTVFLDSAVASGAAPGAVLGISVAGSRFLHATGQMGADHPAPVTPSTVYDLASLTKVVGLTTAVMLAVDDGKVDLDLPIQRYLPGFTGEGKDRVTARLLLAHASGLPAWRPLYREIDNRSGAMSLAGETPLTSRPGAAECYSDLGIIVLTQLIETVYGERLDSLLHRRVFRPLGMTSVRFQPPAEERERIAPSELDPWRGRVLRGEVHDENAARMDGVSGHAGLFGSAPDLLTFAEWVINRRTGGEADRSTGSEKTSGRPSIRPSVLSEFTSRQNLVPGSTRALGWDTPSPGGSAGSLLSPSSFGHTGFTGTSLWIDPARKVAIVLLSNRVNPTRANPRWTVVRSRIADLVMTTLFEDAR